jgi:hypothetical protein
MEIRITIEEGEVLNEILEARHRELLREISRSHNHPEFRKGLRHRAAALDSILNQVKHLLAQELVSR